MEILADGQQFVGFGIHPDTLAPYQWPERSPLDIPVAEVPLVTLAMLEQFVTEAEQILRAAGARTAREIKDRNKQNRNAQPRRQQLRGSAWWRQAKPGGGGRCARPHPQRYGL